MVIWRRRLKLKCQCKWRQEIGHTKLRPGTRHREQQQELPILISIKDHPKDLTNNLLNFRQIVHHRWQSQIKAYRHSAILKIYNPIPWDNFTCMTTLTTFTKEMEHKPIPYSWKITLIWRTFNWNPLWMYLT